MVFFAMISVRLFWKCVGRISKGFDYRRHQQLGGMKCNSRLSVRHPETSCFVAYEEYRPKAVTGFDPARVSVVLAR
jgi:hypothetical protein